MFSSLSQLHFHQPLWLFLLIPLALVLWLFSRSRPNTSAWAKVIDQNLLPYLLQGKESKVSKLPKWLLAIGGLIAITALANPVWEKLARPVFQTNSARVIVLDLSNSMVVDDLKPSRLARARFKIEDILSEDEEGQTGLVVFAGDAFTASPLTRDVDTIRNLLQVFTPQLMPAQGSRVDYGLIKAHELLKQAGVKNGQVLLIADGVSNPDATYKAAEALKADGHTLSVLAVGTEKGGLLRFRTKQINVSLDAESLKKVSKKGGGGYHIITANNTDLKTVLKNSVSSDKQNQSETDDFKSDDWKSTGPYLLLLLLPMAALAFRKGWLLNIIIAIGLIGAFTQPQAVYAENSESESAVKDNKMDESAVGESMDAGTLAEEVEVSDGTVSLADSASKQWKRLWLNKEQLADRALKQKDYQQASLLSQAPLRKGSASYKNKNYKGALDDFQKGLSADARYNEGNTLVKLKKYKEAIESYDKALKISPNMEDAKVNKKAIEDFLKRKKEQEKDKKKDGEKDGKGEKGKDGEGKEGKGEEEKEGKEGGDNKNQFDKANKSLDKDKEKEKKAAEDKDAKDKASKAEKADPKENAAEKERKDKQSEAMKAAKAKAEELSKEEKMAAEQWLRRIPDDPGGLLRRKFRRQYQRNNRRPNDAQPW